MTDHIIKNLFAKNNLTHVLYAHLHMQMYYIIC